jgi:hypothetical protein
MMGWPHARLFVPNSFPGSVATLPESMLKGLNDDDINIQASSIGSDREHDDTP